MSMADESALLVACPAAVPTVRGRRLGVPSYARRWSP